MMLTASEFLRLFCQHVLPRGLVRIRHFGFLAKTCRAALIALPRPAACIQNSAEAASLRFHTSNKALPSLWRQQDPRNVPISTQKGSKAF